jgi:hypothetical protein
MQRGGEWCYSQPDYFLENERITKRLRRVAFCLPRYHDSDQRAVMATTWALVGQWTALQQVGNLLHAEGRGTKCLIWASLRNNRAACMKGIGDTIKAELGKGDMQEAFRLLKGRYRAASDTVARPCPQMMVQQMRSR